MMPTQNALTSAIVKTMSSSEIASLVESRHDSVMRTIERCAERGVVTLPPLVEVPSNRAGPRTITVYQLDKRSSLIVVAQLSPEYTARIVDRWQELEAAAVTFDSGAPALREAADTLETMLRVANLLSVPVHMAQVEAVKHIRLTHQVDFTPMLMLAPAQVNVRPVDEMLEPTEIGKMFGISAIKTNRMLEAAGLQVKGPLRWEPTPDAEGMWSLHQWVDGNKSGYNLKWRLSAVKEVFETENA